MVVLEPVQYVFLHMHVDFPTKAEDLSRQNIQYLQFAAIQDFQPTNICNLPPHFICLRVLCLALRFDVGRLLLRFMATCDSEI